MLWLDWERNESGEMKLVMVGVEGRDEESAGEEEKKTRLGSGLVWW